MEQLNQQSDSDVDFMSMLSHQLATPLGTIRWNAELLRMGQMTKPLDPGQAEIVGEIVEGALRMDELLTDIHDCSRLAQNKFTDMQTPVSLAAITSTVKEANQKDITAKNLTCTVEAGQAVPEMISSPNILTIITQNLLSNAIKYTPSGGTVTLLVRQANAEELATSAVQGQGGVFMSVTDSGYGIPKEQYDKVFTKFFRADNISGLGVHGTGLGLYIVATAVTKLGGKVWFESEVDHGTTMRVVLPTNKV